MSSGHAAGSPYTREDWWAIVGPSPRPIATVFDTTPHDRARRLAGPEVLGDLSLVSVDVPLIEYNRDEPNSLDGTIEHESWPIIVEGRAPVGTYFEHDLETAKRVVKTAVLLSLEWREPWVVRSTPFYSQNIAPHAPKSWDPPPGVRPDTPWSVRVIADNPEAYPPVSLSPWLAQAWSTLETEVEVWNAAITWHEGLILQPRHPSFAVVAYVSAIDALTKSEFARKRLGMNPKFSKDSGERVKQMLHHHLGSDAEQLIHLMYKSRNDASHDGLLQGFEASLGTWSALTLRSNMIDGIATPTLEPNPDDGVHKFLFGVLGPLAHAAHALVRQVLMVP